MLISYSKLMRNVAAMTVNDLLMILDSGLHFWPPCIWSSKN